MNKGLFFSLLGILLFSLFLFWGNIKIEKKEAKERVIFVYLNISNYSNAWMEEDNIYFISKPGEVINGNALITNNEKESLNFRVILSGELYSKNILFVSNDSFYLNPLETINLGVSLKIPLNFNKNSQGTIRIKN